MSAVELVIGYVRNCILCYLPGEVPLAVGGLHVGQLGLPPRNLFNGLGEPHRLCYRIRA